MNYAEIAGAVSEAIGVDIQYVPEELDAFRARLTGVGLPPFVIQHLSAVFEEYQQNMLTGTNDLIEELTGIAPMSIGEFARQHIAQFRSAPHRETTMQSH